MSLELISKSKIREHIIKHYTENSIRNNGVNARIKSDSVLKTIIKNKLIDMLKDYQINFGKDIIQNWNKIKESIHENYNIINENINYQQYKKILINVINEYSYIQNNKFLSDAAEIFITTYSICVADEYLKNFINVYKNKKVKPNENSYIKEIEGEGLMIKFKKCDNLIDTDREIILEKNIKIHKNNIIDNISNIFGFNKNNVYIEK